MNNKTEKLELISAYLDGELSGSDAEKAEKLIETSLELKNKFEELKKTKELTQKVKSISESPYFETKLMAAIESQKPDRSKLRKWIPAAALVLLTLVVMVILKINPDLLDNMWEDQKTMIAGFYKENLKPVLLAANLTTDDIFNFAMNNELPLDNTRKQYLLLGYDDSGKEFFEIRASDEKVKRESYDNFISAMKLNSEQKEIVDSILSSYSDVLESQLLVNDKNTVAINPNLWNYRKAIFADILVAAEKMNAKEFHKLIPDGIDIKDKLRIVNAVQKLKSSPANQYIFVTPDSVFTEAYVFNPASHENEIKKIEKEIAEREKEIQQFTINIRYDTTLKHLTSVNQPVNNFNITVDPNICRVEIPELNIPVAQIPDIDSIDEMIKNATNNIHFFAFKVPQVEKSKTGIRFKYFDGDAVKSYEVKYDELNLDSIIASKHQLDMYNLDQLKTPERFDDSMLTKYQFDRDYYLRYFNNEEMRKEMEKLQNELSRFREEMKSWQEKSRKEVTTGKKR